jgi:hypothetical protein
MIKSNSLGFIAEAFQYLDVKSDGMNGPLKLTF